MEAEDREIQQAKLQELIRKGTPRDLAEANHLMKILSGYDDKYKTDYRAKVAEEVEQLRRKADLLREMLLGVAEGETIGQGDVFEVPPPIPPNHGTVFLGVWRLTWGGPGALDSGLATEITEIGGRRSRRHRSSLQTPRTKPTHRRRPRTLRQAPQGGLPGCRRRRRQPPQRPHHADQTAYKRGRRANFPH
jgi:hypothetical protein